MAETRLEFYFVGGWGAWGGCGGFFTVTAITPRRGRRIQPTVAFAIHVHPLAAEWAPGA